MWLHFGPFSSSVCDAALLAGRFFFLLVFSELTLWQFIKYLYLFWPRYLLSINDNFMAAFLTFLNISLNLILIVVANMNAFQNSEIDFHICTGKDPQQNINNTINLYHLQHGGNKIPLVTFKTVRSIDYVHLATQVLSFLLFIFATQIWVKSLKERCRNNEDPSGLEISKKALYGAGGSLIVIAIIILLLTPSQISIYIFSQNPELVNTGPGKIWTYVSRITMSLISYCAVPVIILINNPNLRQTLSNKIKNCITCSN